MSYLIVGFASLLVAGLTFFSGFGLGTLLMPLFALFFPVQIAVAATAVVHLANNIFKVIIIGRKASLKIVLLFGIPAALAAFAGAYTLSYLSVMKPMLRYEFAGALHTVLPVKLAIGLLMIFFAVFELTPMLDRFSFSARWISVGGLLSGFFGGLTGHQGALRTVFLSRANLKKESFVGTIAVVAMLVDVVRISVYGMTILRGYSGAFGASNTSLVITASLAAWCGSFIGSRLLKKITMRSIRIIIGVLLLLLGGGLASGLL